MLKGLLIYVIKMQIYIFIATTNTFRTTVPAVKLEIQFQFVVCLPGSSVAKGASQKRGAA